MSGSMCRVLMCRLLVKHHEKCSKSLPFVAGVHTSSKYSYGSPIADPENRGGAQIGTNFDTLGSWNNKLTMSVDYEKSLRQGRLIPEVKVESIGIASLLGRRDTNEDRYKVVALKPNLMMFAIFDGHGGSAAVDYVHQNIADMIAELLVKGTEDLDVVLRKAFLNLNTALTRHLCRHAKEKDPMLTSGTTATVCLLRDGVELVVANVGDSRALLCREGQALRLTNDHDPENAAEVERIKKCGGVIIHSSIGRARVNGRLEMTRSLGDVDLKRFGVIAEPEIRQMKVKHGKDAFLVLVTDGVHFVVNDTDLLNVVCMSQNPAEAAKFLTDQAMQFGSEDNGTAIVVPFGAWGKYSPNSSSVRISFGKNILRY